jgi:hypothetical protein
MAQSKSHPVAKALLVSWSILFFLYALLGAWEGTGPTALGGPSTPTDTALAGIWLGFSALQLAVAVAVYKYAKPWLFRIAAICAALSVCAVCGPLLALLVVA